MKHTVLAMMGSIVLLASCKEQKSEVRSLPADVIPVRVVSPETAANGGTTEVTGSFTTDDEVYLSFKNGGIINRVYVKDGDAIRKGQVLATLDMTEINAMVAQYKLGAEKARRDYDRVHNLYVDSVATLEQLQNAKTAMDLATQQLDAATFNQRYSQIVADKAGYVLKKMVSEGQLVAAGTLVFLVNGAGSAGWLLRVAVSDAQWASIHVHDEADITAGTASTDVLKGTVVRKSEGVDPASGLLTADIQLSTQKGSGIAAGMFGKAVIHTSRSSGADTNAWYIPYEALLDGDGRTGYVFVTGDGQTAHKVKVTIAALEKDRIAIHDGLEGAGQVIVTGSAYLSENSKIRIEK